MTETYLAIEIGGTKLQCAIGQGASILETRRFEVAPEKGAPGLRAQLEMAVPELLKRHPVAGIGVGFGGPVDRKLGKISRSHQIEGWSDFPIAGWLQQLANVPVTLENDANVAALGEASNGAGKGLDPVFYVTLGSGVGGGLVANGAIYHGMTPGEAEIGHVRLDKAGTIVESRCSGWAVDRKIRDRTLAHPESVLAQMTRGIERGEARYLRRAIGQGDSIAKDILEQTSEDLAFGLSHVVHLFHPEVIIIGGGLSLVGELLRSAVEKNLRRFIMEVFQPGPAIRLAALGEEAVPVGALVLAAQAAESRHI